MTDADIELAATGRAIRCLGGPQAFARVLRAGVEAATDDEESRAHGMAVGTALMHRCLEAHRAAQRAALATGIDLPVRASRRSWNAVIGSVEIGTP